MQKIRKHPTYRNATHTQSVLTITSNVVYGKHTGNTPDGRRAGAPFGPGANPMHGRDSHGWLASCLSLAKLPYKDSLDGISYTVSVAPQKAHLSEKELIDGAVKAFDMYFDQGGFHMNLNVIDKETLEDAMKNPGQVSAAHDPSVRLCRQLRPADAGAAERRDQPHLPRPDLRSAEEVSCHRLGNLEAGSRHDLRVGISPDAPDEADFRDDGEGAFGYAHSYEIVFPLRRTGPAGRSCSYRVACFAARTATIPIPGI